MRKEPLTKGVLLQVFNLLKPELHSLTVLQFVTLLVVGYAGLLRWNDLSQIIAEEVHCTQKYAVIHQEAARMTSYDMEVGFT